MTSTQYTHFFLFDLDDTLYARSDPFLRAFREKISDRGDYDPDALYRSFLARGHDLFEDAMNGRIPMNDMYIYRICSAAASQGIEVTAEGLAFQENLYLADEPSAACRSDPGDAGYAQPSACISGNCNQRAKRAATDEVS